MTRRVCKVLPITGYVLLLFYGCGYRIEEAATRIPVSVIWKPNVRSAECCRFSQLVEAQKYFSRESDAARCRDAINLRASGDTVNITRLTSGFNSTRLLHRFIVFDLHTNDGGDHRLMVEVTDQIVSKGVLEL